MKELSPSKKTYILFTSPCQPSLLKCGLGHTGFLEYGGGLINGD